MLNRTQDVVLYLIHNQKHLKEVLKPLTEYKQKLLNKHNIFSDDINNEYNQIVKRTLSEYCSKNLACDAETAMIVIEKLNIQEYVEI